MDKQTANRIYNNFPPEGRNMPREQFVRELQELTDQDKMASDLARIRLEKKIRKELKL